MDYKKLAQLLYPNALDAEEIEKKYPPRNLPEGAEVTRFAPSPTGYLHIGGFFSALIDYQIARASNGIFYFRCEDTDQKREVAGADKIALEMLKLLNVYPDEGWTLDGDKGAYGPYKQSMRAPIYQAFAKKLVSEGKAFPCFCTKTEGKEDVLELRAARYDKNSTNEEYDPCRNLSYEEIEEKIRAGKKFALRLKTHGKDGDRIKFFDVKKGEIEMQANAKDVVLVKEDGIPPYTFAHPIDDYLMRTTLVVRGEEWLPQTPVHLEIFEALGFEPPRYFHAPLISKLTEAGGREKISKRKHPEADMRFFVKNGYPVKSIRAYVLNLINSGFEQWLAQHPDSELDEFKFGGDEITAVMPVFDDVKLNDISKNIIARLSASQVYEYVLVWAKEYSPKFAEILIERPEFCTKVFNIDREGAKPRKDIYNWAMIEDYFGYMFHRPCIDKALIDDEDNFKEFIATYLASFKLASTKEDWFAGVKDIAQKLGYATDNKQFKAQPELFKGNTAKVCEYIRIALTGKKDAPDLYTLMTILGESEVKERFTEAIK